MRAAKTVNIEVYRVSSRFSSKVSVIRCGAVISNPMNGPLESVAYNLQRYSVSTESSRGL